MLSEPGADKERVLSQGGHSEPVSPTHLRLNWETQSLHTSFVWYQVRVEPGKVYKRLSKEAGPTWLTELPAFTDNGLDPVLGGGFAAFVKRALIVI